MNALTKLSVAAAFAAAGCVIGDAGGAGRLDDALLELDGPPVAADGITPAVVSVWGEAHTALTLRARGASFVGGGVDEQSDIHTVVLSDVGGEGFAQVALVSTQPGIATLSLGLSPAQASLEIPFEPVRVDLMQPVPIDRQPGQIIHLICALANTGHGELSLSPTTPEVSIAPAAMSLDVNPEVSSQCESLITDDRRYQGAAAFYWLTRDGTGEVEINYRGAVGEPLVVERISLRGEVFPGYEVTAQRVEVVDQWARLSVQLSYREVAQLPPEPAVGAGLGTIHSIPAGLTLVGHSAGDDSVEPATDGDGWVTLYFELAGEAVSYSVFATPRGDGTLHLGEIEVP